MSQVIEIKSRAVPTEPIEEAEAILEDWAPGAELVTAEGRQLLLDALEVFGEQLFDEFRGSGCSDRGVFQRLIWCQDLAYTFELAQRVEVAIGRRLQAV